MGKIQVRAFFGNADKSRFGRCEAVFEAKGFKNVSIILRVLIDKPHLEFCKYLNWKRFYIILGLLRWFYNNQYFVDFVKIVCFFTSGAGALEIYPC